MANQEYEKKLQELQAEIDKLKAFKPTEYKRWRAENQDIYFCAEHDESIGFSIECADPIDEYRYSTGNYFFTEEEAEQHKAYLLALQTIKDDAEGWIPDQRQAKWHGCYNYYSKKLDTDYSYSHQTQGVIYFETKKKLQHSQKVHEAEWLTVLGVEQ